MESGFARALSSNRGPHCRTLLSCRSRGGTDSLSDLDGLEVEKEHLWRLGDDPSFAANDAEPAGWRKQPIESFPDSWKGIGWLRFKVRVEPSLVGRPIGLRVVQEGAAAMPPALIYRAAMAEVEAVIISSLPLVSFREQSHEEITLDLHPSDRVVLMSDGLPETLDAEIQPLGYDRVEALVAEHGALDPAGLITALVEAGHNHARDHRADDDVTIMVIGVR